MLFFSLNTMYYSALFFLLKYDRQFDKVVDKDELKQNSNEQILFQEVELLGSYILTARAKSD